MVVQISPQARCPPLKAPDKNISNPPKAIHGTNPAKSETCTLVDTCAGIADLVNTLKDLAEPKGQEDFFDLEDIPISQPLLYIDLKVVQTSRHGSISTMQILASPNNQTFLVDILTLGEKAFSTPGKSGETLKDILQSSWIPKVLFDVRSITDALRVNLQVDVCRVTDLQLMELATSATSKLFVSTLAECIERDLSLSPAETKLTREIKQKGLDLLAPESGGSYKIFNARPLTDDLRLFFIQDVQYMSKLYQQYLSKITENWAGRLSLESSSRVRGRQPETDDSEHQEMASTPKGWDNILIPRISCCDQAYQPESEYATGAIAVWDALGEREKADGSLSKHTVNCPAGWEDLDFPTPGWEDFDVPTPGWEEN